MSGAIRADQVGSLLRPQELLEARRGEASEAVLRPLEDRHILRLLERQRELGVDVFTDGELRRRNFMSDLMDSVEGFDFREALPRSWKGEGQTPPASVTGVVVSRLRQVRRLTEHVCRPTRRWCWAW